MREDFAGALHVIERCLLSVVATFLAMIVVGISAHGGGRTGAPRTVDFHPGGAAVTSAP